MVDHLTRITVAFDGSATRAERVEGLAAALVARGFTLRRERRRLIAESFEVEAQEAKRWLRAQGYQDREYQVFLEYARQWGMM